MQFIEDTQGLDQVIEYWHGWYWCRFALGQALLSKVDQICKEYPEAETIGDLPGAIGLECCEMLDIAFRQQEILTHENIPNPGTTIS